VVACSGGGSHQLDIGASLSSVEIISIGRVGVGFSKGVEGIIQGVEASRTLAAPFDAPPSLSPICQGVAIS
jgi:hypothetical protein